MWKFIWMASAVVFIFAGATVVIAGPLCLFVKKLRKPASLSFTTTGVSLILFLFANTLREKTPEETAVEAARMQQQQIELAAARQEQDRKSAEYNAELQRKEDDRKREIARKDEEKKREADRKDAECRTDLSCWGNKFNIEATFACRSPVERLAKNDFQWTDGWTETKFSRFRWKNRDKGVVTYIGDKIKYQNGFGAWTRSIYTCDYDTANKRVLNVEAIPGQLPD